MSTPMHKLLERLGLSEKQAKTYLASLSLGKASMRELAGRSGLNRTTLYEIVDQLCSLGLMTKEGVGWGRTFSPADPKLLNILIESKRSALADALPELSKIYSNGPEHDSVVRVDTRTGIRSVYEALFADVEFDEWYLVLTDLDRWVRLDPEFASEFARRRSKKIRGTRLLTTGGRLAGERRREGEALRILPDGMDVPVNLVVTPRKVVLHQMTGREELLMLNGAAISSMFRQIFEILWQQAATPPRTAGGKE
jgi:predicted transcriptional regulator